jgi:hypothetical protein
VGAESHYISDREQDGGARRGLAEISLGIGLMQRRSLASPDRNADVRLAALDMARQEAKAPVFSEKINTARARRTPLIQRCRLLGPAVIGRLHPSATPGTPENKAAPTGSGSRIQSGVIVQRAAPQPLVGL